MTGYVPGEIIPLECSIGLIRLALATTWTLAAIAVFAAGLVAAVMLTVGLAASAFTAFAAGLAALGVATIGAVLAAGFAALVAAVAGRITIATSPGARLMGVVGPSSVPLVRCTSILTRSRTLLVVFSTVPMKALLAAS